MNAGVAVVLGVGVAVVLGVGVAVVLGVGVAVVLGVGVAVVLGVGVAVVLGVGVAVVLGVGVAVAVVLGVGVAVVLGVGVAVVQGVGVAVAYLVLGLTVGVVAVGLTQQSPLQPPASAQPCLSLRLLQPHPTNIQASTMKEIAMSPPLGIHCSLMIVLPPPLLPLLLLLLLPPLLLILMPSQRTEMIIPRVLPIPVMFMMTRLHLQGYPASEMLALVVEPLVPVATVPHQPTTTITNTTATLHLVVELLAPVPHQPTTIITTAILPLVVQPLAVVPPHKQTLTTTIVNTTTTTLIQVLQRAFHMNALAVVKSTTRN